MLAVSTVLITTMVAVAVCGIAALIVWWRREPDLEADVEMKALLKEMKQKRREFDKSTKKQLKALGRELDEDEKELNRVEKAIGRRTDAALAALGKTRADLRKPQDELEK